MKYVHLYQRYQLFLLIWQKLEYLLQHIFHLSTSRRPCYCCLISNKDLNNMSLTNIILRTPENMNEAIDTNQSKEVSIHTEFIFFWKFKDFNIYKATVPDR